MLITRLSATRALAKISKTATAAHEVSASSQHTQSKLKLEAHTGRAVTIGNFDGVHLGHQALFRSLNTKAHASGLTSCALSFEPHPREFFAKIAVTASGNEGSASSKAPARINSARNKLLNLSNCALDQVALLRFDSVLAGLSPEQFVESILVQQLNTKLLVVGDDFRFGKGRTGDFTWLRTIAPRHGFDVQQMPTVIAENDSAEPLRISSSLVRECLARGDFAAAQQLTGRTYTICGHVIHGRKLGRELGFPTLNIAVGPHTPALHGIYVVTVHGLGKDPKQAVASLGTRPAIESNGRYLLEVFILNWQGDAYGQLLSIEFHAKLRGELKYEGLEPLKAQIAQDVRDTHAYFAQNV